MTEFFKAELKDKFLGYACSRDDYFETQLLYDEFLRPHYDLKMVEKLVLEILDYDANLLDTISGNGVKIFMISSTAYTDEFLEVAGFKDLYIQEEEKWDSFLQHLGADGPLSRKEEMKSKSGERSLKQEKRWIIGLLSALAFSFLTSFVLLLIALFGPNRVRKTEFEERVSRMEVLHQEEVQSLRREIKAIRAHQRAQHLTLKDSL